MAIPAGPTGPFVLSLSKDRLRVFGLIEIANPRIEYGIAMTKWIRFKNVCAFWLSAISIPDRRE